MRRLITTLIAFFTTAVLALTATGCSDEDSQDRENKARQSGYDQLTRRQPATTMKYSPTRETINKWIKTWGKPNKIAYVYVQNAKGEYGYYVIKGLPVSYCAMLTPNYEIKDRTNGDLAVNAPGMDGAYYSGGQCNSYYAFDATTGAYMEFTIGANQSFFLYDRPQTLPEFESAKRLGDTSIDDVKE